MKMRIGEDHGEPVCVIDGFTFKDILSIIAAWIMRDGIVYGIESYSGE